MKKFIILNLLISLLIISCSKNSDIIQNKIELTEITPMTGYIGDEITIKFSNTNDIKIDSAKVLFNGIQSQIKDTLNNKLICVVPKSASTGKIKIKINNTHLESKEDFVIDIPSFPNMYYYSGDWGNGLSLYRVDFNSDEAKFRSKKLFNTNFYMDYIIKTVYDKSNSRIVALGDNNSYIGNNINKGWSYEGGCMSYFGCDYNIKTMFSTQDQKTYLLQEEHNTSTNKSENYLKEIGGDKSLITGETLPHSNKDLYISEINKLVYFRKEENPNKIFLNSIDTKNHTSLNKEINLQIDDNDIERLFKYELELTYNRSKKSILLINLFQDVFEYSLENNILRKVEIPELKSPSSNLKYLVFDSNKNEALLFTYSLVFVLNLDDYSVKKFDLYLSRGRSTSQIIIAD